MGVELQNLNMTCRRVAGGSHPPRIDRTNLTDPITSIQIFVIYGQNHSHPCSNLSPNLVEILPSLARSSGDHETSNEDPLESQLLLLLSVST